MVDSISYYPAIQQNKAKYNFGAATQTTPAKTDTVEISKEEKPKKIAQSYPRDRRNFWEKNQAAIMGISSLASIAFVGLFLLSMTRGGSLAAKKPESLLRKFVPDEHSPKGFDDVIGLKNAKDAFDRLLIQPLESPEFRKNYKDKYGIDFPNPSGFLLVGDPGNGKTLLVEALAQKLKLDMYQINIADLGSEYIHKTGSNIAKAIDTVKAKAKTSQKPVILFLDELDAMTRNRNIDSKNHELEELNTLLQNTNDLQKHNIILIGATNRKELIDPAIKRPGRFSEHIFIDNPNAEERKLFVTTLLEKMKAQKLLGRQNDIKEIADAMEGFSNAEVKNIIENASILASKDNMADVSKKHFTVAINHFKESHKTELIKRKIEKEMMEDFIKEVEEKPKEETMPLLDNILGKGTADRLVDSVEKYAETAKETMAQFQNDLINNLRNPLESNIENSAGDLENIIGKTNKKDKSNIVDVKAAKKEIDELVPDTKEHPEAKITKTKVQKPTSDMPADEIKQKLSQQLQKDIKRIASLSLENVPKEDHIRRRQQLIDEVLDKYRKTNPDLRDEKYEFKKPQEPIQNNIENKKSENNKPLQEVLKEMIQNKNYVIPANIVPKNQQELDTICWTIQRNSDIPDEQKPKIINEILDRYNKAKPNSSKK